MNEKDEHDCGKEIQSNYFQTDFKVTVNRNDGIEIHGAYSDTDEEYSPKEYMSKNINVELKIHDKEGAEALVRPPLVGQASGDATKFDVADKGEMVDQGLPSPASASSLISVKPLEWDSGADVGYFQEDQPQISTIERLALNGSQFKRSDPEGTTGSILVQQLGPPDAESTRVGSSDSKDSSDEHQHPLFPEVIVQNHEVSDSETEKEEKKNKMKDFTGSNTFPRMQTHHDMHPRIREIAGVKSNSNSSVATVVKNQENIQNEKNPSETESVQTNSFEYVPGDKYENSNSPRNLEKDVEKGVQILSEFMKGAGANDTLSKKQLLKHVVNAIIQKRYPEDEEWEGEVFEGRCFTRRGQNRYDISGESTPREDSRDSVVSRMEKKAAEGHSGSSNSYKNTTTTDHTSDDSRPKAEGQVPVKIPSSRRSSSSKEEKFNEQKTSSNEDRVDWHGPITAAEKAYEMRKSKEKSLDPKLSRFLSSERENQLEWIKKEINHLSNLKTLLEKHETIKKHFAHLRHSKEKHHQFQRRRETKSAPVRRPVETEISSDQSSWHSHGYESKRKGLLKRNASTNTGMSIVTEMAKPAAKSVAYTIVFQGSDKENEKNKDFNAMIADREKLKRESEERVKEQLSNLKIQEELMAKKPDYILRAENRRQVVAELAALREIRNQNKHKILAAAINDDIPNDIPPNPLAVRRVVSQKAMRNLTEKTYKKTTEIKQKQMEQKRKQDYQTNRLMAELFNKKLQRKVLRGETDLSNSVNVISSV